MDWKTTRQLDSLVFYKRLVRRVKRGRGRVSLALWLSFQTSPTMFTRLLDEIYTCNGFVEKGFQIGKEEENVGLQEHSIRKRGFLPHGQKRIRLFKIASHPWYLSRLPKLGWRDDAAFFASEYPG